RVTTWTCSRRCCSAVPVSEEIFDRIANFEHLAVEQVVCAVDDDELFGIVGARVELLHVFQRAEFVPLALNEELRLLTRPHTLEVVSRQRRRDADERRHVVVFGADSERHPAAEGHTDRPEAYARIARPHERQAGAKVVELAASLVPRTFARPDAAEVESQHGA